MSITTIEKLVAEAMQDGWNDICGDTGHHPLDIERNFEGRKGSIGFSPRHWSAAVARHLSVSLGDLDKIKCWNLVEALRATEGNAITLVCDNPDFNGQPNNAVVCNGDWTKWNDTRFTGDTILEALINAHDAMLRFQDMRLVSAD